MHVNDRISDYLESFAILERSYSNTFITSP